MSDQRVLVAEKVGASGINLLEEHFDVELGFDWDRDQVKQRLPEFDGILIRSATKLDAELLAAGTNLKAIGRAGVGVDNVDVPEASKRGIVVANAPLSNVVTAAEHTMALLLALARNVPQADASLKAGRWDRSKYSGVELYEKTLGVVGFGRIGQLVAERAKGFGMKVIAYDPVVSDERYKELGVERADTPEDVYAVADFLTLHLPKTPETTGWLNADVLAQVQGRGARAQRRARPARRRRGPPGGARQRQGRRGGARRVPDRADHRAPAVRLPERDRHAAPRRIDGRGQRPCRLPGRRADRRGADRRLGHDRRQHPGDPRGGHRGADPVRAARRALGKIAASLVEDAAIDTVKTEFLGGIASRDTRLLGLNVLMGVLAAQGAEDLNEVNAPALAEQRGIRRLRQAGTMPATTPT